MFVCIEHVQLNSTQINFNVPGWGGSSVWVGRTSLNSVHSFTSPSSNHIKIKELPNRKQNNKCIWQCFHTFLPPWQWISFHIGYLSLCLSYCSRFAHGSCFICFLCWSTCFAVYSFWFVYLMIISIFAHLWAIISVGCSGCVRLATSQTNKTYISQFDHSRKAGNY